MWEELEGKYFNLDRRKLMSDTGDGYKIVKVVDKMDT